MRVLPGFLAFTALLCIAAAPDPTRDASVNGKPVKEKKVCHSQAPIGSLVETRTCHTHAEWEQLARDGNKDAQETLTRLQANGGSPR